MTSLNYVPGRYLTGVGRTVMFVGEAPGKNEAEQGSPFVGRSGKYLIGQLAEHLPFRRIYLTNTVKVRPEENRKPRAGEILSWVHILEDEVLTTNPLLVVTLGETARYAMNIIKPGYMVFNAYHPAYANRFPAAGEVFRRQLEQVRVLINELEERYREEE